MLGSGLNCAKTGKHTAEESSCPKKLEMALTINNKDIGKGCFLILF